jgi:hypothetical protein
VAQYRQANQTLVRLAQRDLTDFWSSLNFAADAAVIRDAALSVMPDLVSSYGDTAAVIGADWYDMLRDVPPSAASFQAVLANPLPVVQVEASTRWALGPLFQQEPDAALALEKLNDVTQRLVLQPGRNSVWDSAAADPVRTGIARVPTGLKTCAFCVMVASRGAVYTSMRAAGEGNEYHGHCHCVPTPIRTPDDWPEGHDVAEFERLYAAQSGI